MHCRATLGRSFAKSSSTVRREITAESIGRAAIVQGKSLVRFFTDEKICNQVNGFLRPCKWKSGTNQSVAEHYSFVLLRLQYPSGNQARFGPILGAVPCSFRRKRALAHEKLVSSNSFSSLTPFFLNHEEKNSLERVYLLQRSAAESTLSTLRVASSSLFHSPPCPFN
jgi:hypothetical protein